MPKQSERNRHLGMLDAVRGDMRKSAERYKTRAAQFAEDEKYDPEVREVFASEFTMVAQGCEQFANFIGMYLGREGYQPPKEGK